MCGFVRVLKICGSSSAYQVGDDIDFQLPVWNLLATVNNKTSNPMNTSANNGLTQDPMRTIDFDNQSFEMLSHLADHKRKLANASKPTTSQGAFIFWFIPFKPDQLETVEEVLLVFASPLLWSTLFFFIA